jgi:Family of unknown function (DUF6328)
LADEKQLEEEIRHALTEIRMVLPGAQALLGFQFITLLLDEFEKLPQSMKTLHLVSLSLIALAVVFLMTPAAYHRIVEKGENTEHFHHFCSRMLLAALVPLGLGFTGDFYVVVWKVSTSDAVSGICTALLLVFIFGAWFGLPVYRKWSS